MELIRSDVFPAIGARKANALYFLTTGDGKLELIATGATADVFASIPAPTDIAGVLNRLDAIEADTTQFAQDILGLTQDIADVNGRAGAIETNLSTNYLTAAQTNAAIAASIGGIDLSTPTEYAGDIATRDALTPTKNIFCVVVDATGDSTVSSGSALYFYVHLTETWMKIAEYESMDLFPNQEVLKLLTDAGGVLYYNGKPVATVTEGTHTW